MTRHIELRNHADAAIPRIFDHLMNLVLRVVDAVRSFFLQQRELLAFGPEPLIVGEMPVENIQLDRLHAIKIALNHRDRYKVATDIDHQAPPRKSGLVVDADSGNGEALRSGSYPVAGKFRRADAPSGFAALRRTCVGVIFQMIGLILSSCCTASLAPVVWMIKLDWFDCASRHNGMPVSRESVSKKR